MASRRATPLPPYRPQLALLVKRPPEGADWLHEIKLDGYRIGCRIDGGRATLLSRRQNDWTASFPAVAAGAGRLRAETAPLAGELAAGLPRGRASPGGGRGVGG